MIRRGRIRFEEHAGDEFSGVKRVLKVLSEVEGDTLRKIDTVHDHKGTLFVSWLKTPNAEDMTRVESAWASGFEYLLHYTYPDGSEFEVATAVTDRRQV